MKSVIRFEELALFLLSIYLFNQFSFAWWWFPVLILLPDVSMAEHAFGNKTDAITYNIFHHKGMAIA